MARLYSLVEPPPPGFTLVSSYQRRYFRGRPFALHATTIHQAEGFLDAELGQLCGILVSTWDAPTQFRVVSPDLYHLQVDSSRASILADFVQPLLLLLDTHTRDKDQSRLAQFELERALQNQQRMADEFEAVRSSLRRELAERRAAEGLLKESERKFRALLDSAFEMVGLLTPDGNMIEANRASLEFAGVTIEQIRGVPFWLTPWCSHSAELQVQVKQAIARCAQGELSRFESTNIDANGVTHYVDVSLKPGFDEDGRVEFLIPEGWDITERKCAEREREQLQAQLMQTQKLESIGRLAGGVAHDFNNMLTVILGRAELALKDINNGTPLYEDLEEIHATAERSAQLTRQLLAFARRQTIKPRTLDLNEAISGMLAMLRRLIGEDLKLQWLPAPELWKVNVDPSQLDQLLANLVVNARDAIAGTGTITISTRNHKVSSGRIDSLRESAAGDYVILSVEDTGAGIPKEVCEHIFEPFFTTKAVGKGTGLGLSTVLGIVEQHQGFIQVQSQPNVGTEFVLHLPRAEEFTVQTASHETASLPLGGTETVLVVEDEQVVLSLQKKILSRLGYRVLAACGPIEALELMADGTLDVDLLLTDVIMPEMNGCELAERLILSHPGLRCLYMSGYSADVFPSRGIIDDRVNFIQKPFSVAQIARKIREVLDEHRAPLEPECP